MPEKIVLRIKRADGPGQPVRIEEFSLPYRKNANVISCLMEIQRNPVLANGSKTTPIAWDSACLEEVCGSCTMVINGKADTAISLPTAAQRARSRRRP